MIIFRFHLLCMYSFFLVGKLHLSSVIFITIYLHMWKVKKSKKKKFGKVWQIKHDEIRATNNCSNLKCLNETVKRKKSLTYLSTYLHILPAYERISHIRIAVCIYTCRYMYIYLCVSASCVKGYVKYYALHWVLNQKVTNYKFPVHVIKMRPV